MPGNSMARDYGSNPHAEYDSRDRPMLYQGPLPRGIHPMARLAAVGDRAWPLERLRRAGEIRADDLVLRWSPGQASALDARRIDEGRDVGNVIVQRRTGSVTETVGTRWYSPLPTVPSTPTAPSIATANKTARLSAGRLAGVVPRG
ncbi:DUF3179 domain-containing (seleno)protein [Thiohalorhabdus sp.]|uniref:DUF3179 domain-containing (seleno)protein n=1 Tax=Thiohalorhabdus sp. TaxID=3094134 RepID=UPI002FC29961